MRMLGVLVSLLVLQSGQPGGEPRGQAGVQAPARPSPATGGTAVIRGRVVDAATGQPLRAAWVSIVAGLPRGIPGETPPWISTDDQGRYEFTGLPSGRFTLNAGSTFQHVFLQYGQRRRSDPPKPVEVTEGQIVERIDFALPRGGFLIARVNDDLGEPVPGMSVQIQTYQFSGGERRLAMFESATTNDVGEAVSRPLPAGDYFVVAGASLSAGVARPTLGANNSRLAFAPTYYPGTLTSASAQGVHVEAGQEARVAFSLLAARTARLSGVIRSADGSPLVRSTVVLRGTPTRIMPQPDGRFTVNDLLPGEYAIEVRPTASDPLSSQELALQPVTLAGEDVLNVVVTTSRSVTVRGRAIFEGGDPPSEHAPNAFSVRAASVTASSLTGTSSLVWNPDWTFELRALWGRGTIRMAESNGWFLKAVMLDGKDVTDTALNFGGSDINGLEVVLTQKRSEVSGTVTDSRNTPVGEFVTVVFPEDRDQRSADSRFIAAARSDKDGRYRILGLPAGRYLAAAVSALDVGEERDPSLLTRLQAAATRFTLSDAESKPLSLKLVVSQ